MSQRKFGCAPKKRVSENTAYFDAGWIAAQTEKTESEIFGMEETAQNRSALVREAYQTCLTETQQLYFTLYYMKGMKLREIAVQCGVSESTVSRTVTRAKRRIRHVLQFAIRRR